MVQFVLDYSCWERFRPVSGTLFQCTDIVTEITRFWLFLGNYWLELLAVFCVCNVLFFANRKWASETWQFPNKVSQKFFKLHLLHSGNTYEKHVISLGTF